MKGTHHTIVAFLVLVLVLGLVLTAPTLRAEDWPGWRGENRDGICLEKGLLPKWPEAGPPLLWKADGLGIGYSAPSVVGNKIFLMGSRDKHEWVFALDLSEEGRPLWERSIGEVRHEGGGYPGPRATPTVDQGRIYCLGCAGNLVCLDADKGAVLWQRDLVKDYGGKIPHWGYSESLLVDGEVVLCTPGGKEGTIAALDKETGELRWKAPLDLPAAYSSPVKGTLGGVVQYVTLTERAVVGVAAKSGKLLWKWDRPAENGGVKIPTCLVTDEFVFAATGYNTGSGALRVRSAPEGMKIEELYFKKSFGGHEGGSVRVDDHVYLSNKVGALMCIELATGKVCWESKGPGKCAPLFADGNLCCRDTRGRVTLVKATPEAYRELGRFQHPARSGKNTWPHPVISRGRLLLRDQESLLCYDLRVARIAP